MNNSTHNNTPGQNRSQIPSFDWPKLRRAIELYKRLGLCYIPLLWGSKKPAINTWEPFQSRIPSLEELAAWFHEGKPTNIAIICGGVSNGLVALCFNAPDGAIQFFGQKLWDKLLASTFVVKTPRGLHVYLRSGTLIPSQIVAKGNNYSWLEIRADGNYIAAPPSLHPSGILYEAIGVENIVKPKNLPDFIEQQVVELGLKARLAQEVPKGKTALAEEYLEGEQSTKFNEIAVKKLLANCAFIQYCRDNAATLTEPHWWAMVHNLAVFGQVGEEMAHELSKAYPQYTETETNQKIEEADKQRRQGKSPHLCQNIGYACPEDCLARKLGLRSPAGLAFRLATQEEYGAYLYHDKQGWHLNLPKLVEDLLSEYSFKTMRDNEECFVYENGVYMPLGEATIKEESEKRVPKKFMHTHDVNEVIGHIKRSTYTNREKFNKEKWVLNLINGLFDTQTNELSPHTPEFLSTIRVPLTYDPQADCLRIKQFFKEVLRAEDIPVVEELFGYCLIPDYSIQKAFLFLGDGANGKSTLLELLKHFIGNSNCTNISLQTIESQRFAVATLFGKLANIYADIPSTKMSHVGLFKMLTGGDTIGAEKKFKDGFSFNNTARLIYSTNKPPKIDEDTLAFWRRWIFINFANKFEGSQADKRLLQKVTKKDEMSGLLNIALQGLRRLVNLQGYSHELSPDEIAEWHLKASDPIYAFVEDVCETEKETWVSKDDLYEAFLSYCDKQNIPRIGKESFGRALKNATNANVSFQKTGPRGAQVHGWRGIQLKREKEDIDMEF